MKAVNVELSVEKVLEVAKTSESNKLLMQALFPSVFEDLKPFIRTGDVFTFDDNAENFYRVMIVPGDSGSEVAIETITSSHIWRGRIAVKNLHMVESRGEFETNTRLTLTKGELYRLMKSSSNNDRTPIVLNARDIKNYLKSNIQ